MWLIRINNKFYWKWTCKYFQKIMFQKSCLVHFLPVKYDMTFGTRNILTWQESALFQYTPNIILDRILVGYWSFELGRDQVFMISLFHTWRISHFFSKHPPILQILHLKIFFGCQVSDVSCRIRAVQGV